MIDEINDVRPQHSLFRDIAFPVYDLREALFVGLVIAVMAVAMTLFTSFRIGLLLMVVLWWGRGLAQLKNRPSSFQVPRSELSFIKNTLSCSSRLVETEHNIWRNPNGSFPYPYRAAVRLDDSPEAVIIRGPQPILVRLRVLLSRDA